jgi:hypothetical protein
VDHSQLVDAASIINAADYALLLVGRINNNTQQAEDGRFSVLYANQAAVDALSSSSSSSNSSSGCTDQVEPCSTAAENLQLVQLPAAVSAMIEQQQQLLQQQAPHQQQQGSLQAQQQDGSSCAVLQQITWQPLQGPGSSSLTVDQLVACHVHAPNGGWQQQQPCTPYWCKMFACPASSNLPKTRTTPQRSSCLCSASKLRNLGPPAPCTAVCRGTALLALQRGQPCGGTPTNVMYAVCFKSTLLLLLLLLQTPT